MSETIKTKEIQMTLTECRNGMKTGAIKFSYHKKDGSVRNATGTTFIDMIPKNMYASENSENRKFSDEVVR